MFTLQPRVVCTAHLYGWCFWANACDTLAWCGLDAVTLASTALVALVQAARRVADAREGDMLPHARYRHGPRRNGDIPVDRRLWEVLSARGGDDRSARQLRAMVMMGTDRDFDAEDYDMLLALDEDTPTKSLGRASVGEISRLPTITYKPPPAAQASSSTLASPSLASSSSTSSATVSNSTSAAPDMEESRTKCLVCLEEFVESEELRLLPCFHYFHSGCIDKWLHEKAQCPICKLSIRESDAGP